jgi:hypothetical protein
MNQQKPTSAQKGIITVFALAAALSFFIPWVKWESVTASARDMATGHFFELTETNFAIANPFPDMVFANAIFWLIPALAFVVLLMVWVRKTYAGWFAAIAGALILGLAMVFVLFTNELKVFNSSIQLPGALQPGWYIAVAGAMGLIFTAWPGRGILKWALIILPLVICYFSFDAIRAKEMKGEQQSTHELKADYTVDAIALIKEFVSNDSLANARYREKILTVTGNISEMNSTDSTATISFADSTGSYAIFDFEKTELPKLKALQVGNKATITALCSGGVFSDILEMETINFKHAILNNK